MKSTVSSENEMRAFGEQLGAQLRGGEVIELIGDVGAGKTTLTKGIVRGMGSDETVQSPTFTLSRVYEADKLRLVHYDFYRLNDPGILRDELAETINDAGTVTVIEWAGIVEGVLPDDHIKIAITSPSETTRELAITGVEL